VFGKMQLLGLAAEDLAAEVVEIKLESLEAAPRLDHQVDEYRSRNELELRSQRFICFRISAASSGSLVARTSRRSSCL